MIDSNIIISVISLIFGGGIAVPFTVQAVKRKANADALAAIQDVYQETIKDLRDERIIQKNEILELRKEIEELREKINQLQKENKQLKYKK